MLLSAFACDPAEGSESGAGWALLIAASQNASSITVLTRCHAAPTLESEVKSLACPVEVVRISTRHDTSKHAYVKYLSWLWEAAHLVRIHSTDFDIVHHVTFASDWLPIPVFRGVSDDCKVVWGPAGGNTYPPMSLALRLSRKGLFRELLRRMVTKPIRRATKRLMQGRVNSFISLNEDSRASAPRAAKVYVHPNCVIPYENYLPINRTAPPLDEHTLIFVGRILEWKGIFLALEAFSLLPKSWKFIVVGDGPDMARLVEKSQGDAHRIHFIGRVDHSDVIAHMAQADVLVFPSLHDSLGWVAAEAAATALPVVCLDLGGVPTVSGANAVAVPPLPASSVSIRLAEAIQQSVTKHFFAERIWTQQAMDTFIGSVYAEVLPQEDRSQINR